MFTVYPNQNKKFDDYWSIPPRPISAVTTHLDRIIKIFTESNVELIAVTDGCDHPHKLETKVRGAELAKTVQALHIMWSQNGGMGYLHDYNEYQKFKKNTPKYGPTFWVMSNNI